MQTGVSMWSEVITCLIHKDSVVDGWFSRCVQVFVTHQLVDAIRRRSSHSKRQVIFWHHQKLISSAIPFRFASNLHRDICRLPLNNRNKVFMWFCLLRMLSGNIIQTLCSRQRGALVDVQPVWRLAGRGGTVDQSAWRNHIRNPSAVQLVV